MNEQNTPAAMFPFPHFTLVDPPRGAMGAGGMEYMTFITLGTHPLLSIWPFDKVLAPEMVTIHEFGHNYWMGMSASKEFEESWLDEGINSYYDMVVTNEAYGGQADVLGLEATAFDNNHASLRGGRYTDPIVRDSWRFRTGGSYGFNSYARPAVTLRHLENLVGTSAFHKAMRAFFQEWRFRHPSTAHLGGRIKLGAKVVCLEKGLDGWVVWAEQAGQRVRYASDHVILATDSPTAASILKDSFPSAVQPLTFPRGMANAIIRVWFDRQPKPGPEAGIFTGEFILHNFFWLERIYSPFRAWNKATGGSVIEAHIYGPPEVLEQPDALLLTNSIMDIYQAYPELRGHLISQHLQRNPATHTLPSLGPRGTHLVVETPWEGLYCAGDWVRDPLPAFFLERACATGIKAANAVLHSRKLQGWPLVEYLPPEPFVGRIEKLMRLGRRRMRDQKK